MTDYTPQPDDRVSLNGVVGSIGPTGLVYVRLYGAGDESLASAAVPAAVLTLVERPAPPEEWQAGDVVRNADDPDDTRVWLLADPRPTTNLQWTAVGGNWWYTRLGLPANLRLLVRGGQPVAQPEQHPQPGDWVTEDAPIGSRVRDSQGEQQERTAEGWRIFEWKDGSPFTDNDPYDFETTDQLYGPLTLVRWGPA